MIKFILRKCRNFLLSDDKVGHAVQHGVEGSSGGGRNILLLILQVVLPVCPASLMLTRCFRFAVNFSVCEGIKDLSLAEMKNFSAIPFTSGRND